MFLKLNEVIFSLSYFFLCDCLLRLLFSFNWNCSFIFIWLFSFWCSWFYFKYFNIPLSFTALRCPLILSDYRPETFWLWSPMLVVGLSIISWFDGSALGVRTRRPKTEFINSFFSRLVFKNKSVRFIWAFLIIINKYFLVKKLRIFKFQLK